MNARKRLSVSCLLDSRHLSAIQIWLGMAVLLLAVSTPGSAAEAGKLLVGAANGQSVKAYDATSGAALGDFTVNGPTSSNQWGLAIGGPNDHLFVQTGASASWDARIDEYDGRTGEFVRTLVSLNFHNSIFGANGLLFGPDGLLYSRDDSPGCCGHGGISRWDAATGALVGSFIPRMLLLGPGENPA